MDRTSLPTKLDIWSDGINLAASWLPSVAAAAFGAVPQGSDPPGASLASGLSMVGRQVHAVARACRVLVRTGPIPARRGGPDR